MPMSDRIDPIRNFKFHVTASHSELGNPFARMGFMSVEGIAMNTEMIPYREGGYNTAPHKLPGQTDFAPLTMSSGVFPDPLGSGMWDMAKHMFAVQHGEGSLAMNTEGKITEFRYDLVVRVLGHPVTAQPGAGSDPADPYNGAVLAWKFINCWTASVGFNGLNAMDNAIVVHQMTVHHEGFDTYFGNQAAIAA